MLKEIFIGRAPSHFQIHAIIKAFIVSEVFLWSAWNFIIPIIAIFSATKISGGSIEVAASAYSVYLIVRVIFELISGRFLLKSDEFKKFFTAILGLLFISVAYLNFAFTHDVISLFISFAIAGMGLGIASPAKNSLFSAHLDKDKESAEWGIYDATVFIGMALSAALGGFIVKQYGFHTLFLLAMVVNLLGIIPYILYIHKDKSRFSLK